MIHRAGKSHTNADDLSRVPRQCLVSECRHCLRKAQQEEDTTANVRVARDTDIESKSLRDQQEEDTTANVRVARDTDIESKSLRDQQLADDTIAPVLKRERTGTAAKLGGYVRDERRREDLLGPVGQPPYARGSSLPAPGIT